jgi:hypothetical protein
VVLLWSSDGSKSGDNLNIHQEKRVVRQSLQYFINEGQWKVIFLCCLVKFSVINAHPPTNDGSFED